MITACEHSAESLAQGALERVFYRNQRGSHALANLLRDGADAAGVTTKEERTAIVQLVEDGLVDLEARGAIMRDRRSESPAWLLTPATLTDRPPGAGQRTRAEDHLPPPL
jgi:hypothetical protein